MDVEVETLKIVHRRPFRRAVWIVVYVLILIGSAWLLFDYGRFSAGFEIKRVLEHAEELQQDNDRLMRAQFVLQEDITMLEQTRQVEQKAHDKVADSLAGLQSEILELTQQLRFYQGIVSPADIEDGAKIKSLRIERAAEQGRYRYTLILVQGPKRARRQIGTVNLRLDGDLKGKPQALSMKQLTLGERSSHKYRFKYFQRLSGYFVVVEEFEPKQMRVSIRPSAKGEEGHERNFSWADLLAGVN
ncbi:hypothetical protein MNBD_GAMMA16-1456 [hydrothermal vent metagenome]|uniref:Uncharacterized protein n=1 Tax=hydrothermal vent metagenome TaxID=652676 RepID=A0A3B0Z992_9ZZZZ